MAPRRSSHGGYAAPAAPNTYDFAPDPVAEAKARAAADFNFRQQFAQRERRATDQMRGSTQSAAPTVVPTTTAMTPAHDWTGFDATFHPAARPVADGSAPPRPGAEAPAFNGNVRNAPRNINGPAVQGLLDRAAGVQPTSPTNTATAYGTGSVRFDKGARAENELPNQGTPIMEDGKQVGVAGGAKGEQPFNLGESRQNLLAAFPEIGQDGTPENKAFVEHANKFGEQSAHENAMDIMRPFLQAKDAGQTTAAQARNELPSAGSTEAQISQNATDKAVGEMGKAKTDAGPFTTDSVGGRALTAMRNTPSLTDAAGNAVTGGARMIGLNDDTATAAGDFVRNAPAKSAQFVRNLFSPKAPDFMPADMPGGRIGGTGGVTSPVSRQNTPPDFAPEGQPGGRIGGTGGVSAPLPATKPDDWTPPAIASGDKPNFASGLLPEQLSQSDLPDVTGVDPNSTAGVGIQQQMAEANRAVGNFAKGLAPKGMKPAMKREKTAIAHHVGGARPGDKPEPVLLAGSPAVVNSGEKIVPNMSGGFPAVLTRNMQKKLPASRQPFSF